MKNNTYEAADMVEVVDGNGAVSTVPSAWVGTDLLPADTKKATKKDRDAAAAGEVATTGTPGEGVIPDGGAAGDSGGDAGDDGKPKK